MAYGTGLKALKRLCVDQSPFLWQKAKLSSVLFRPYEQATYEWIRDHLKTHHVLPQLETLHAQFPDTTPIDVPEPASYYILQLEQQYFYDTLNSVNLKSQETLKADQNAHEQAATILRDGLRTITEQKYRVRILDVAKDAPALVLTAYHHMSMSDIRAAFGWPFMDLQSGGVMPGDVISFVGRPAVGKTYLTLWTAIHNWTVKKLNVLYVSMEMMTLPIAQRITALYTKQNIEQLKMGGYSQQTFKKFAAGLQALKQESAKMYVVDGNLATNVEDLFALADMLECRLVFIDGAYLLRHKNTRLDRFTRAAENVELIKRHCTDLEMMSFCSWQFNREATKKQKKGGADFGDLEDIGYSDSIGQISSIALGLFQEDSVETIKTRKVQVMKGRNGEVGQFSIAWDFQGMSFHQTNPAIMTQKPELENPEMGWV